MGISKAVGIVGFALFFAAVCFKDSSIKLIPVSLLLDSFIACIVSVASHPAINFPSILGKGSDGKFPLLSKVIFFPFLFLVRVYVFFRRLKSREPIYNEISDGLYVGGWPSSKKHLPPGEPAVIDCTCELSRSSDIPEDAYLCLLIWDTRAPQVKQIETAVLWARKMRDQKKPIYIHCAFDKKNLCMCPANIGWRFMVSQQQRKPNWRPVASCGGRRQPKGGILSGICNGHGRSVCVMCAVLVTLGVSDDWKAAEKLVKEKRPMIRMNLLHRKRLEEWSKFL